MVKHCRALLDNKQDVTQCVAFKNTMWEHLKHTSCKKMYISDAQLHAMELSIFDGIKVQLEGLEG
jgi:hypothetical protein